MPGGNGTGPWGAGPMTGRGMGFCPGYSVPGFMNTTAGFGKGRGFGTGRFGGRGFGRMFWGWQRFGQFGSNFSSESVNEKDSLKQTAEALKSQLDQINKRLEEMAGDN
ncbi:DUF5320 domain-containing protein [candidate division WOR-3 bacterium]|nr:DUF5320 domain-containing protein [candidate division WOR-3 bacterium]